MSILEKAKEIAEKINSLKDMDRECILRNIGQDLADYMQECIKSDDKEMVLESFKIIGSTGINKEGNAFIDTGFEVDFKELIPIDFIFKTFINKNEIIKYNGILISKFKAACMLLELEGIVRDIHIKLLFNEDIEVTDISKRLEDLEDR